ncbi:hypothetical protein [Streptomyces yangpuensis]|uniref:hypothetical protein n=1 Tax=Streptomyces yangpuensis TaxID=1648182 RepID=UPI0037FBB546
MNPARSWPAARPEAASARTAGQEMAALGELYRRVVRLAGRKHLVAVVDDLGRAAASPSCCAPYCAVSGPAAPPTRA